MKKFFALLLALSMLLTLGACGEEKRAKKEAYENAEACFAQKRYDDAARFYFEADGYEDSSKKILEIYYIALNLFETEHYLEAQYLFSILATESINDSQKYVVITRAYTSFQSDFNAVTAIQTLEPYQDIYGVSGMIREIKDVCYEGTYLVRFDYYAKRYTDDSFEVKVRDKTSTFSNYSNAIEYEYRSQKRGSNAQLAYVRYIQELGAHSSDDYPTYFHLWPKDNPDLFKDGQDSKLNFMIVLSGYNVYVYVFTK